MLPELLAWLKAERPDVVLADFATQAASQAVEARGKGATKKTAEGGFAGCEAGHGRGSGCGFGCGGVFAFSSLSLPLYLCFSRSKALRRTVR